MIDSFGRTGQIESLQWPINERSMSMNDLAQNTAARFAMRSGTSMKIRLVSSTSFRPISALSAFLFLISAAGLTANAEACVAPSDEISRWNGDDDADSVGSHDVTRAGNATSGSAAGIDSSGYAFNFDGSGDYATTNSMTLPATGSFVLWVRPSNLFDGLNALAGTHGRNTVRRLQVSYTGEAGRATANAFETVGLFGTAASPNTRVASDTEGRFRINEWTMVAVTWDYTSDQDYMVYVDGVPIGSATGSEDAPTEEFLFGAELYASPFTEFNGYFEGSIDEVRVFDDVLSACEVDALHAVEVPDSDGDGVADKDDDCTTVPNGPLEASDQLDFDQDGLGTACDPDYDQDGGVTSSDFGTFLSFLSPQACNFSITDPAAEADHDGDLCVTTADFGTFLEYFGNMPPGPSGLACADPELDINASPPDAPCVGQ